SAQPSLVTRAKREWRIDGLAARGARAGRVVAGDARRVPERFDARIQPAGGAEALGTELNTHFTPVRPGDAPRERLRVRKTDADSLAGQRRPAGHAPQAYAAPADVEDRTRHH